MNATGNCGVGSGLDDRFDFQLVTGEFLDGAGLNYINNSYHSFGNNGSTYNTDIIFGQQYSSINRRDFLHQSTGA